MGNKKVLLVATVLSHIAQFHRPLAIMLHSKGYKIHIAAKNNLAEKNGLKIDWAEKIYDLPFSRSPKSLDNIKAYKKLRKITISEKYEFVHCNTPMGGIVTRLATRKSRTNGTNVIYTAHGFHFYKGASIINWLIFYPIEKIFCRWTDKLITINHEDFKLSSSKFNVSTYYIHGVGVDEKRYKPCIDESERILIKKELNIPGSTKVILSVGELLPNKNQKMVIYAMKEIIHKFPNTLLIIAGNGPEKNNLENIITDLNLNDNVRLIGYCTFLEKYQKIADVLAACSYREGLPLNLVEAMLSKNPIVATKNRGHNELIKDGETGYIVPIDNSSEMAKKIILILSNKHLKEKLVNTARQYALQYSFSHVKEELKKIYFPK